MNAFLLCMALIIVAPNAYGMNTFLAYATLGYYQTKKENQQQTNQNSKDLPQEELKAFWKRTPRYPDDIESKQDNNPGEFVARQGASVPSYELLWNNKRPDVFACTNGENNSLDIREIATKSRIQSIPLKELSYNPFISTNENIVGCKCDGDFIHADKIALYDISTNKVKILDQEDKIKRHIMHFALHPTKNAFICSYHPRRQGGYIDSDIYQFDENLKPIHEKTVTIQDSTGSSGVWWTQAFHPSEMKVAMQLKDGCASIHDANTGKELQSWQEKNVIRLLQWTPKGNFLLATHYEDDTIDVYKLGQQQKLFQVKYPNWIRTFWLKMGIATNERWIPIMYGNKVRILDLEQQKLLDEKNIDRTIRDAQISPDGKLLALIASNKLVSYDTTTGKYIRTIIGTDYDKLWNRNKLRIAWSPDSKHLASCESYGSTGVYLYKKEDLSKPDIQQGKVEQKDFLPVQFKKEEHSLDFKPEF